MLELIKVTVTDGPVSALPIPPRVSLSPACLPLSVRVHGRKMGQYIALFLLTSEEKLVLVPGKLALVFGFSFGPELGRGWALWLL